MKHVMHCNMLYLFQALLYPKRKEKKKKREKQKNKKGKKSFQFRGNGGERVAILVAQHKQ